MPRQKPAVVTVDQIQDAARNGVSLAIEERKGVNAPEGIIDIIIGLILS